MYSKQKLNEIADTNEETITRLRTREQKQYWKKGGYQIPTLLLRILLKKRD